MLWEAANAPALGFNSLGLTLLAASAVSGKVPPF